MSKAQKLLLALKQNPFVLAPMAGITDHAFRSFMKARGAGIVITELVSSTGIEYKSEKTLSLMSFGNDQRPLGIQLFGEDPSTMAKAAQVVQEMGADFVDINFGCPVPKVVKKGAGSAALKDLPHMTRILNAMVRAVEIPVTIKIRTGWDQGTKNALEVCKIAFNEGITWVSIHGRTRAQGYSGLADWDYIAEVKAKSPIPVIGNGDILTAKQAVQRLSVSGVDGVMIGRGCLKNPYIFTEANKLWNDLEEPSQAMKDYEKLVNELYEVLCIHCSDRIVQIQLKKFSAWFATGFPNAAQFRKALFQSQSTEEILQIAREFFSKLKHEVQADTSHEAFLMGGHG